MINDDTTTIYRGILDEIEHAALTKKERVMMTPQGADVGLVNRKDSVINFCANNYLGLSNHPDVLNAAKQSLSDYGYGLSSVRFICGTQTIHKDLEASLSDFLGMEDSILYSSCFDANGGLFETLLSSEDAVISDRLNHASIIDGIRLCKAQKYLYPNGDMNALEDKLKEAQHAKIRLIATDGVFSMDGYIAQLETICHLAEKYNALVMVDDSHSTGVLGKTGRGTHEHCDVMGRVDIITSTLGKALGGAAGGFIASNKIVIDLLRQRSRPYLFSNSLSPVIVGASLAVLSLLKSQNTLQMKLMRNAKQFRDGMIGERFSIPDGVHPIVPVMFGDALLATTMAEQLLSMGIYVIGFSYPVVPKKQARIRVQLSAAHTEKQIDDAVVCFAKARSMIS